MRKFLKFVFGLALVLGVVIGLLRLVAIRWWRVPDDDPYFEASISPTLHAGDWIILWRLTPPHFGDLVLCPEPKAPERPVIGRIAGEAGDIVKVSGHVVSINGHRARSEGNCAVDVFTTADPQTHIPTEQGCQMEEIGQRVHMRGNVTARQRPPDSTTTVGQGQIFLLSDNRLFSYDSRDFGPAERETCTETVVFRLVGKAGFNDVATRMTLIR